MNDGIDHLEEQQLDNATLAWRRIVHHEDPAAPNTVGGLTVPNTVEGVLDSDVLSSCPEILQGEAVMFKIITVEEAHKRIAENPDKPMHYFEEQPSDDERSIWQRMGCNGGLEDGFIMLQLPVTNRSTTAEETATASEEQCEEREQCELEEDDYAILESPADNFVMISGANVPHGSEI